MTRPGVVALVFFTGVPMLGLAEGGWPPVGRSLLLLAGIAAIAGASSVFNAFLERHLDARMARTRGRPLPTGVVQPAEALVFGALLTAAGLGLIGAVGHPLGVLIGALTVAFYVFVYTVWLKPRTPLNIVIGGAAGAAPPLIVDAALHGSVGLASVSLFALVFLWTPPHFWAISLFRKDDYASAGFPMLPLTHGDEATRRRIVLYALSMIPPSLMLVPTGQLSVGYGLAALAIGGWFVWRCVVLLRERSDAAARGVMFASLLHLHLLCTAMTLDLLV
jgi:protoheme IX farnesyltransferase